MTAPLSKVETGAEKKELIKQKEKKKPNWKLWGGIGGICGSALIVLFIVLGVRSRSTLKREGVNTRGNNSKQPESDETGGSGASRDGSKALHRLKPPVIKDSKDSTKGETADTGSSSILQQKPPGPKVLDPIKLTRQQTGPADRINNPNSSGSETRTTKTDSADPLVTTPIVPSTTTNTISQQVDTTESDASGIDPNSRNNVSQSEILLPSNFIEPTPDNVSEDVGDVIRNVDNPTDFKNALNKLRRNVQPPEGLLDSKVSYYADNLVENEMRKAVLKNVMEGDQEKIKAALNKYHKAVQQTNAVVELPSDARDIKDVEMYRIVRKCLSEGTLSASDKTELEDILSSPEKTHTMAEHSSQCLGLKLKDDSVEDAAATVKAYFSASDQMK